MDAARRQRARGVLERVVQVHAVVHAPAEVLVEAKAPLNSSPSMFELVWTFQPLMSWLNDEAQLNMELMSGRGGVPRADVLVEGRRSRVAVRAIVCAEQFRRVRHPPAPTQKCGRTSPRLRTGRQTKSSPPSNAIVVIT